MSFLSVAKAHHLRDFASARAIALRAEAETATAGTHSGGTVAERPKPPRGRAKAQTKVPPKSGNVPVHHEAAPVRAVSRWTPSVPDGAVMCQNGWGDRSLPPGEGCH